MNTTIHNNNQRDKILFSGLCEGQAFVLVSNLAKNQVMIKTRYAKLRAEYCAVNAVSLHDGALWSIDDSEMCVPLHCLGFGPSCLCGCFTDALEVKP